MKITKSKLKQLIKKELKEVLTNNISGAIDWIKEMKALLLDIRSKYGMQRKKEDSKSWETEDVLELYNNMPDEGKPYLLKNLKMYAEKYPEMTEFAEYLSALERIK